MRLEKLVCSWAHGLVRCTCINAICHDLIHRPLFLDFLLLPSLTSPWLRFLLAFAFSCADLTATLNLASSSFSATYNSR